MLSEGPFVVGDLHIEARHVDHIPDSFAFRVSAADAEGAGLVYSGDCGVAGDLLPLVRPGDTVLCEAAFGIERSIPGIHLTAGEAGSVAAQGSAARLILTHVLDRYDRDEVRRAAEAVFSGEVTLAEPGLTVSI